MDKCSVCECDLPNERIHLGLLGKKPIAIWI